MCARHSRTDHAWDVSVLLTMHELTENSSERKRLNSNSGRLIVKSLLIQFGVTLSHFGESHFSITLLLSSS